MILTGNELNDPEHKVLNELFGKIEKIPADGDYNLKPATHDLQLLQTQLMRNWLHYCLGHIM